MGVDSSSRLTRPHGRLEEKGKLVGAGPMLLLLLVIDFYAFSDANEAVRPTNDLNTLLGTRASYDEQKSQPFLCTVSLGAALPRRLEFFHI